MWLLSTYLTKATFQGKIDDAAAIMMYHCVRMSAPLIKRLQNCKLIIRCGVGYDNIDISTARAQGIPVANVPDYGTEEVADSAIGMSLALARGFKFAQCASPARRRTVDT